MIENRKIAKRYAKAFLHGEVNLDEVDKLVEEIHALDMALGADERFREYLTSPVNPKENKIRIMREIADKFSLSPLTAAFVEVLIGKRRMNIMHEVYEELLAVSDMLHDRIRVSVVTAYEPSVTDIEDLARKINKYFERKVLVSRSIDESIIGGFVIEGEGKRIDMSVRGQIERLLENV